MKTLSKTTFFLSATLCFASLSGEPIMDFGDNAQLHFLATGEANYESNLFLRSTNRASDIYFVFSPGLELRLAQEGAASAVVRYQHRFTAFRNYSELDDDFADFDMQARYNSGVVLGSAYANYKQLASNTVDANRDGVLIKRSQSNAGVSARYEISELTAVKVGVDYTKLDYEDDFYTDYKSYSIPVTFFYKVRPKIDLTAGARYRNTDTSHALGMVPDYKDLYYFVGAVGEFFSPVIFADVSVGYQKRDYKGTNLDLSSASYDITFIYTGDPKTTYYAGISRDYRTSAINGTAYAFTSVSLGARYRMSQFIGLNAGLVYGESEYQQSPRAEDILMLNLGASYHPNDYLTLSASYGYSNVDGANIFSSDYTNNKVRIVASLRY
jgi:polysaccharide biosynthesis protein VpsM